jgi:hypothetical protein
MKRKRLTVFLEQGLVWLSTLIVMFVAAPRMFGQTVIPGGIISGFWTTAGSPYQVSGDAYIPSGAQLVIESGVTVEFAAFDSSLSGLDPARVEFTVYGMLTAYPGVTFRGQSATPGSWYGIVVVSGGTEPDVILTGTTVKHARYGLDMSCQLGPLSQFSEASFIENQYGVWLHNSSWPDLDGIRSANNSIGLYVLAGEATLTNLIVQDNTADGIFVAGADQDPLTPIMIVNATIHHNGGTGVAVAGSSTAKVSVVNGLVTSNGEGLADRTGGGDKISSSYSDVFGNLVDRIGVPAGSGDMSIDPLYINSPVDIHLQPTSPVIDMGTSAGAPGIDYDGVTRPQGCCIDMGAFECEPPPPSITVTSPNGGEVWHIGSTYDITWTQTGLTGLVTIGLTGNGFNSILGTPEATAGTFSWTIMPDVPPGTEYDISIWQGEFHDIEDESDDEFAIVSGPPFKIADFDGDGQEDILWRYQGSGAYQGWNVVWLLNQTAGLATGRLEINGQGASKASLRKGSSPQFWQEAPLDLENPRVRGAGRFAETPMRMGDPPVQSRKRVMRDPMEFDRSKRTDIPTVPTMKDAEMAAAASGGEMKIAALGIEGYLYLNTISDLSWEIAGTGDFDGDTDTDILWRNYGAGAFSGWNVIWYMNSAGGIDGYGYLSGITDLTWRIVGTGDFDGDGDTDILWRNYGTGDFSGWNVIWHMAGEGISGYGYLYGISDLDWKIMGTGDFNRDGYLDILWRNCGTGAYSGWNVIWYMNGDGVASYGYLSGISDLAWEIAGTGDFNNDGYMDILWRNYGTGGLQGWNCIWYMQGEGIIGYDYPMTIPDTNWRIVNR